ncbi:hypothetical protein RJ640_004667 [Escallonia rubra]|uniref:Aminotransferase-like plant mobile domain-containing protein n=1 Tax=Escallonia rubra TaxID=112253 RepID=A0AA88URB9_9ASTE|nr:hypothetical protein RJ640_004667 [Escallonia rubra]
MEASPHTSHTTLPWISPVQALTVHGMKSAKRASAVTSFFSWDSIADFVHTLLRPLRSLMGNRGVSYSAYSSYVDQYTLHFKDFIPLHIFANTGQKPVLLADAGASEVLEHGLVIVHCAPIQLLKLWAWERFPALQPTAKIMNFEEPRSARWHDLKNQLAVEDVRAAVDSAGEDPYEEHFRSSRPISIDEYLGFGMLRYSFHTRPEET